MKKSLSKRNEDGKTTGCEKAKGEVVKLVDDYTAEIRILDAEENKEVVIRVDQEHLETVIPALGKEMLIVNGAYRGERATLLEILEDKFSLKLKIKQGTRNGRIVECSSPLKAQCFAFSSAPKAAPAAAPAQGPGLMGQMVSEIFVVALPNRLISTAATAGGVAIGSAIGHSIGNMFGGGRVRRRFSLAIPTTTTSSISSSNRLCLSRRQFMDCTQNQNDLSVCQSFNDISSSASLAFRIRKIADSAADVAYHCREIVTMLPNGSDNLYKILLFRTLQPGSLCMDTSTISHQQQKKVAKMVTQKQSSFVDAPVSGGIGGAEKATLTFMASGGDEEAFNRAKKIFQLMGRMCFIDPKNAARC
uniref:3-hydroxyisobutyrate dehydrogenase n=1 Tax=Ditylenchus dipsaci TaxID=166011 RepID=A0A915E1T3_9BILA